MAIEQDMPSDAVYSDRMLAESSGATWDKRRDAVVDRGLQSLRHLVDVHTSLRSTSVFAISILLKPSSCVAAEITTAHGCLRAHSL